MSIVVGSTQATKKSPTSEIFLPPHCGRWNAKTRLLCIFSSLIEFRLAFRAVRSIYWRRMDKINLFSRFFPIYPPSCVGTHAYARCGSQLDCTRKRAQESERERERGRERHVAMVGSKGQLLVTWPTPPVSHFFLFSQHIMQYYNRCGQVNKCVCALNNVKNGIFSINAIFCWREISFVLCVVIK
jgi:hypothetical protein